MRGLGFEDWGVGCFHVKPLPEGEGHHHRRRRCLHCIEMFSASKACLQPVLMKKIPQASYQRRLS